MKLIVPITRWPGGRRIGPKEKQDWYRQLQVSVKLLKRYPDSKILLLSAVVIGEAKEVEMYYDALCEIGLRKGLPNIAQRIELVEEGWETIGQINYLLMRQMGVLRAKKEGLSDLVEDLVIVSVWTQYFRILHFRWSELDMESLHIAFGLPIISYIHVDIILTFLFPILDTLISGFRERFQAWAIERRRQGKL